MRNQNLLLSKLLFLEEPRQKEPVDSITQNALHGSGVDTYRNIAVARNDVVYQAFGERHDTKYRDALNCFAGYCLECSQHINWLNGIMRFTCWGHGLHSGYLLSKYVNVGWSQLDWMSFLIAKHNHWRAYKVAKIAFGIVIATFYRTTMLPADVSWLHQFVDWHYSSILTFWRQNASQMAGILIRQLCQRLVATGISEIWSEVMALIMALIGWLRIGWGIIPWIRMGESANGAE